LTINDFLVSEMKPNLLQIGTNYFSSFL